MCHVLKVSRSGYYAWRRRGESARSRQDAELLSRIRAIHRDTRGAYGAPRIHEELVKGEGLRCSRKRVARLMRGAGIVGAHPRRFCGSTRRDERQEPRPDLVQRDFTAPGPNRLWVADLTQRMTGEGFLYLSTVLDVFSRRVVGWAMGDRATTELVLTALDMAVWNRRPETGLIQLGPWLSIWLGGLYEAATGGGYCGVDGKRRGCLRQRRGRELLRHPPNGVVRPRTVADTGSSRDGDLQLHRGFLQSDKAALVPGRPEPGGLREGHAELQRDHPIDTVRDGGILLRKWVPQGQAASSWGMTL